MRVEKFDLRLVALFISSMAVLFVGFGLFPLLPGYASGFGASQGGVGIFLAAITILNAIGAMTVSWLSAKISRPNLFIFAGTVGIISLALLSQVQTLWQAVGLVSLVWWSGGVILTLVNIFIGQLTKEKNRNLVFSLMALSVPLGSLSGGIAVGSLFTLGGYPILFLGLSALWWIFPIIGIGLRSLTSRENLSENARFGKQNVEIGNGFRYLLLVTLFSAVAISTSRLGTPLGMQALEFHPRELANSASISGLLSIPMILLISFFSSKVGVKLVLILVNLMVAFGVLGLVGARELWHFYFVATMMMVGFSTNGSLMAALAIEMMDPERVSKGLSLIGSTNSAASVLSFAGLGFMLQQFGERVVYGLAAGLAIFAAAQLLILPGKSPLRHRFYSFKRACIYQRVFGWFAQRASPEIAGAPCN